MTSLACFPVDSVVHLFSLFVSTILFSSLVAVRQSRTVTFICPSVQQALVLGQLPLPTSHRTSSSYTHALDAHRRRRRPPSFPFSGLTRSFEAASRPHIVSRPLTHTFCPSRTSNFSHLSGLDEASSDLVSRLIKTGPLLSAGYEKSCLHICSPSISATDRQMISARSVIRSRR